MVYFFEYWDKNTTNNTLQLQIKCNKCIPFIDKGATLHRHRKAL